MKERIMFHDALQNYSLKTWGPRPSAHVERYSNGLVYACSDNEESLMDFLENEGFIGTDNGWIHSKLKIVAIFCAHSDKYHASYNALHYSK